MPELPDLTCLSHDEKDALIRALWAQVQMLTAQVQTLAARVADLEAKLGEPPKTPDNSSVPPSQGKEPNRVDNPKREGQRKVRAAWVGRAADGSWWRTLTRR